MKENRAKDEKFQYKKGLGKVNQMVILELKNYVCN